MWPLASLHASCGIPCTEAAGQTVQQFFVRLLKTGCGRGLGARVVWNIVVTAVFHTFRAPTPAALVLNISDVQFL